MTLRARIVVFLLVLLVLAALPHHWWTLPAGAVVYLVLFWGPLGRNAQCAIRESHAPPPGEEEGMGTVGEWRP